MPDQAPNGRAFVTLLEAFRGSGGTVPAHILSRLLAEHPAGQAAGLATLLRFRQVFGFEWRGCVWVPMFQFESADLCTAVAPQTVRAALPPHWSGWALAQWFGLPLAQLDGQRPVDLLALHLPDVIRAARAESDQPAQLVRPALSDAAYARPPQPQAVARHA